MSALDEKVDCAWLQSGLTGHRGTDRILDKGGRLAKPNEGCNETQGKIIKNTFKPILSSECRKKENVRLRFGQPIILAVPSN